MKNIISERSLTKFTFDFSNIDQLIKDSLNEDILTGDLSTDFLVSDDNKAECVIKAKSDGIISGLFVAQKVFKFMDSNLIWNECFSDGDRIKSGDIIVKIKAKYNAILKAERTALNFLQRMSGISTKTNLFVSAVDDYKTEILDTRKTLPGFRMLDKYAVYMGGGSNHRIGLYDMVMLKENHIKIGGGILQSVQSVRKSINKNILIEVETTNLNDVKLALEANVDLIMLDNMTLDEMKNAVEIISDKAKSEASGNMSLDRVKEVASVGVDYISVGALTHSVEALDLSLIVL